MPNDCPYCGKPHFNFGDYGGRSKPSAMGVCEWRVGYL